MYGMYVCPMGPPVRQSTTHLTPFRWAYPWAMAMCALVADGSIWSLVSRQSTNHLYNMVWAIAVAQLVIEYRRYDRMHVDCRFGRNDNAETQHDVERAEVIYPHSLMAHAMLYI